MCYLCIFGLDSYLKLYFAFIVCIVTVNGKYLCYCEKRTSLIQNES